MRTASNRALRHLAYMGRLMVGYAAGAAVMGALFVATMAGSAGHWGMLACAVAVALACIPVAYVGAVRAPSPPWTPFGAARGGRPD